MMKYRKNKRWSLLMLFLLLPVLLCACLSEELPGDARTEGSEESVVLDDGTEDNRREETSPAEPMELHFIDVGQGDSTLIINGKHAMMIDAGDNAHGVALQLYLQKLGIKQLDYMVLTHPDSDHIGGADVLLYKLDVQKVLMEDDRKENDTYRDVLDALEYRDLSYEVPKPGEIYELGDARFTIVAPNNSYENVNNHSIALVLEKGDKRFLFTGDCEEAAETDMLENGLDLTADVYHVAHHGTRYASSADFLDRVKPAAAVLSCAMGNEYGYPHQGALNRLRERDICLYRTDEQGSIVATCDGKEIIWSVPASETWQGGEDRRNSVKVTAPEVEPDSGICIVNKKSGTIHSADCESLPALSNQVVFSTVEEAEDAGYHKLCGYCILEKE